MALGTLGRPGTAVAAAGTMSPPAPRPGAPIRAIPWLTRWRPLEDLGPGPDTNGSNERPVGTLLARADRLTGLDVEYLAAAAVRHCQGPRYAEALLAARRAAEGSDRRASAESAAHRAETLVARAADAGCRGGLDERARWTVVAERASWGVSDAARALVVEDVLAEEHRRLLTLAWEDLQAARGR